MSFMDTMNSKDTKTNKTNSKTTSYTLGSGTNGGRHGWICPVCGCGNAPWVSSCSCRGYWTYPTYPWWTQPWYVTCGNTTTATSTKVTTDGKPTAWNCIGEVYTKYAKGDTSEK